MKHFLLVSIFLIVISGCQTSNSNGETNITVAAAASLSDAMKEVNELYEDEHPNTEITLNLASSGVLANQIKQGAPIDVYLSASESHFHEVEENDLIDPDHHTNLLRNKLVLIKSKAAELNNFDHLRSNNIDRIAIGTPETVPAGAYAKESLQSLKLWDKLQDKFIFGKDVRQVLTYVETGNAEAGLV
ncbi:MAG: molybdate ABC transporter substrate-binding protein, partial [Anaerobacillus sp.]